MRHPIGGRTLDLGGSLFDTACRYRAQISDANGSVLQGTSSHQPSRLPSTNWTAHDLVLELTLGDCTC